MVMVVSGLDLWVDTKLEPYSVQFKAFSSAIGLERVIRIVMYGIACYFYSRERVRLKEC